MMRSDAKTLPERFWDKVMKTEGCWLWTASTIRNGYGKLNHHGKMLTAHRTSWMLHHGDIPEGKLVLHHCDNKLCVNPEHLYIGTKADNVRDAIERGQHPTHCWLKPGHKNELRYGKH